MLASGAAWWALALVVLVGWALWTVLRLARARRSGFDIAEDSAYVEALNVLSEGSVRRKFDPFADIDWDAPEMAITPDDPRWVLWGLLGAHPWYRAQPLQRQIAMGMWYEAGVCRAAADLEGILVSGLLHYAAWVPHDSPERRYCLHECAEEANHTLMFREMTARIDLGSRGLPWWLRLASLSYPMFAATMPALFFFGVLTGETPIDYLQKAMLRRPRELHPLLNTVTAIHVAEEARHLSFAEGYLRKRVPDLTRGYRFVLSLYVPFMMRVMVQSSAVPERRFFKEFGVPRRVRREAFFRSPASRAAVSDMCADVRMLCHDVELMNPVARLAWRLWGVSGVPSRFRSDPRRAFTAGRLEEQAAELG